MEQQGATAQRQYCRSRGPEGTALGMPSMQSPVVPLTRSRSAWFTLATPGIAVPNGWLGRFCAKDLSVTIVMQVLKNRKLNQPQGFPVSSGLKLQPAHAPSDVRKRVSPRIACLARTAFRPAIPAARRNRTSWTTRIVAVTAIPLWELDYSASRLLRLS